MKSRSGSYKKILIEVETLRLQGDYLRTNLEALKHLNLTPKDFTTLYLLLFLRIKHPKNWLQQKSKSHIQTNFDPLLLTIIPETFNLTNWEIEKLKGVSCFTLFSSFSMKAIPESINRTMLHWFDGSWTMAPVSCSLL